MKVYIVSRHFSDGSGGGVVAAFQEKKDAHEFKRMLELEISNTWCGDPDLLETIFISPVNLTENLKELEGE